MTKRPSLAATMKAVKEAPATAPVVALVPTQTPTEAAKGARPYFAATREGMKRLTLTVPPEEHRRLKRYAVDTGRPLEALMREALTDFFAKVSL